jgi:hypothetical protein
MAYGITLVASLQFVYFVSDRIIEEALEVPPNEPDWSGPVNLLVIDLPERAEGGPSSLARRVGFIGTHHLRVLGLAKVRSPQLVLAAQNGPPRVGVHDVPLVGSALRNQVSMSPVRAELRSLSRNHQYARTTAK